MIDLAQKILQGPRIPDSPGDWWLNRFGWEQTCRVYRRTGRPGLWLGDWPLRTGEFAAPYWHGALVSRADTEALARALIQVTQERDELRGALARAGR